MKILDEDLKFMIPNRIMREMLTLRYIDENPHISQHKLARAIGVSSSMANTYIREMNEAGWISVRGESNRSMHYHLTDAGRQKKSAFLHRFTMDISRIYSLAKREFEKTLLSYCNEGLKRVVLYGASDAGEIVFHSSHNVPLEVVAVVDCDASTLSNRFGSVPIISPEHIEQYHPDAVVITSFVREDEITRELEPLRQKGVKVRNIYAGK